LAKRAGLKDFDLLLVFGIVLAFCLVAEVKSYVPGVMPWLGEDRRGMLGAEYDSIARSLVKSGCFSDPFNVKSGPTAWMPPFFPFLLATLYYGSFGDRFVVVSFILFLQFIVLILNGLIVTALARKYRMAILGYCTVIFAYSFNFHELFQKSHDIWIQSLVAIAIWFSLRRLRELRFYLGLFAGVSFLVNPVMGFCLTVMTFSKLRMSFPKSCAYLLACVVIVSPWVIRNRICVGDWYFVKSNLNYELWQSQCVDNDGVLDQSTMTNHPWARDGVERLEYTSLGEREYLKQKGRLVLADICERPFKFLDRIKNRMIAVFLLYSPYYDAEAAYPYILLARSLAYPLPFLGAVIALTRRNYETGVRLTALMYFTVLLPYALISYYNRYSLPIITLKMALVLFLFQWISTKSVYVCLAIRCVCLGKLGLDHNSGRC
jgi:hypothetical protein